MIPYQDANYADTRIRETVLMYKGSPVEVKSHVLNGGDLAAALDHYPSEGPPEKNGVLVKDILSGACKVVSVHEIDPNIPELGYVNFNGQACYVVRVPKRRCWRQGIRYTNLQSYSGVPVHKIPFSAIGKMMLHEYPSFEDCLKNIEKAPQKRSKLSSIAWHLDWAMDTSGRIYYQSDEVGTLIEGRVSLSPEYTYLQEALDESC